jgi:hypothetical protein
MCVYNRECVLNSVKLGVKFSVIRVYIIENVCNRECVVHS